MAIAQPGSYARAMAVAAPPLPFGDLLRGWRQRRRLSQLELSLESSVSARHLSFIETGRATPSRDMVLHLADQLGVPLRQRNAMLLAAGYAPAYRERALDDAEMTPVRDAIDRFLRAHEPYPALVCDRCWNIHAANDALQVLLGGVAPDLIEPPANALRISLHPEGLAPHIANFAEWSAHVVERVHSRMVASGDASLEALHAELVAYPGVVSSSHVPDSAGFDILVPLRLRHPAGELELLSTVSTFVTASDITLAELSIEAFYPANAQTAQLLLTSTLTGSPLTGS